MLNVVNSYFALVKYLLASGVDEGCHEHQNYVNYENYFYDDVENSKKSGLKLWRLESNHQGNENCIESGEEQDHQVPNLLLFVLVGNYPFLAHQL